MQNLVSVQVLAPLFNKPFFEGDFISFGQEKTGMARTIDLLKVIIFGFASGFSFLTTWNMLPNVTPFLSELEGLTIQNSAQ